MLYMLQVYDYFRGTFTLLIVCFSHYNGAKPTLRSGPLDGMQTNASNSQSLQSKSWRMPIPLLIDFPPLTHAYTMSLETTKTIQIVQNSHKGGCTRVPIYDARSSRIDYSGKRESHLPAMPSPGHPCSFPQDTLIGMPLKQSMLHPARQQQTSISSIVIQICRCQKRQGTPAGIELQEMHIRSVPWVQLNVDIYYLILLIFIASQTLSISLDKTQKNNKYKILKVNNIKKAFILKQRWFPSDLTKNIFGETQIISILLSSLTRHHQHMFCDKALCLLW